MQAAIYSLAGPALTADERAFFADVDPAGYILFRRNCETRAQLKALTDELRAIHGRLELPILIDQEGGRVARMRPPEWPSFPSGEAFDRLYQLAPSSAIEAARMNARAIALVLAECGVNVNCLPMLDVRQPGATDIVGDRAYGGEPMQVSALGRAVLDGMATAGVIGVVKHMPGHGRALVDSHHELPVVTASDDALASDLEPFERLASAPMGMVAHIVFTAWDAERPSSQSPTVIERIIRQRIGFGGFLMTDDIGMEALSGSPGERSAAALAAGCDATLHCSGKYHEMLDIAAHVGALTPEADARLARAMAAVMLDGDGPDLAAATAKRDELLALV
ncbi:MULTISPECIES: beta-N-acetylhexosaminidase [Sphingomonas]|uniref:beta-N-acetylhexosaminidase n=1 Tax=Sphingomonas TaxID=13687 RepID=UPI000DEFC719|nr:MULTISPECIES: beta-N-acetylhexosaminidase [Sphingomonas]